MAVSLGDDLGIAEMAFNFRVWRLCQNVSVYRPDCLFQTVTGFWEVTPVNHVKLRTYRTDHRQWSLETVQSGLEIADL